MRTPMPPFSLRLLGLALVFLAAPSRAADEPPKLAGTWTWTWQDRVGTTHRHVLEVEGVGTKLAARELFDDQPAVKATNLTLQGNAVHFIVDRAGRKAEYSGKVADADHINGTVTITADGSEAQEFVWKAERKTKELPK